MRGQDDWERIAIRAGRRTAWLIILWFVAGITLGTAAALVMIRC